MMKTHIALFALLAVAAPLFCGGPAAAQDVYQQAIQHFERAQQYAAQRQFDKAIIEFKKVIDFNPNFAPAYLNIGILYLQKNDAKNGEKWIKWAIEKAPEQDPAAAMARGALASIRAQQGNDKEAERLYREAIKLNPKYLEARVSLGMLYLRMNRPIEAEQQLAEAKKLAPDNKGLLMQLGSMYAARGEAQKAAKEFEGAAKLDPKDPQPLIFAAQAYEMANETDKALGFYEQAKKAVPGNTDVLMAMAGLYQRTRQVEKANACLQEAIAINPKDVRAHIGLGMSAFTQQDTETALRYLTKAYELEPDNPEVLTILTTVYVSSRPPMYDKAEQVWQDQVKRHPDSADAYFGVARIQAQAQKTSQALESLQKALEIDPKHIVSLQRIASLYDELDDVENAVASYEKLIEYYPEQKEMTQSQMLALYKKNEMYDEASALADRIIEAAKKDPERSKDVRPYIEIAQIMFAGDRDEDGIARLEQAKKADHESVEPYRELARHYQSKGKNEEALTELKGFVASKPDDFDGHASLASLYGDIGDDDAAIVEYEVALKINPKDKRTWAQLGRILERHQRYEEAVTQYRIAVEHNPEDAGLLMNLASAYEQTENFENARETYLKVYEKNPQNPWAATKAALALDAMGKTDEAILEFKKMLKENPSNSQPYSNLFKLYEQTERLNLFALLMFDLADDDANNRNALTYLQRAYDRLGDKETYTAKLEALSQKHPDAIIPLDRLMDAYAAAKETDKAIEIAEKLVELQPNDTARRSRYAGLLLDTGQTDLAKQELDAILAKDPQNPDAMRKLADLAEKEEDWETAIAWRRRMTEVRPDDHTWRRDLARTLQNAGKAEEARAEYEKILAAQPHSMIEREAISGIEKTFSAAERPDDFFPYMMKRIDDFPTSEVLWTSLRRFLSARDRSDEYVTKLSEYHSKDTANRAVGTLLAEELAKKEDFEGAAAVLSALRESLPEDSDIAGRLAQVRVKQGEYDLAIAEYDRALQLNEGHFVSLKGKGEAYHAKGDFKQAIEWLRKAVDALPRKFEAEACTMIAESLEQLGKTDEAIAEYENILTFAPRNVKATAALERLKPSEPEDEGAEEPESPENGNNSDDGD